MKNPIYKKNSNLFIIALLAVFALSTSCKKFLYEDPISQTYSEKFWTSEKSVNQASMAMYFQLRDCLRSEHSHFIFGDLTSDLFHCSYNSDWELDAVRASHNPPFFFSYVPYKEYALQDWSRYYKLIAQCNLILEQVPLMSDGLFTSADKKNSYTGEALFMRAYAYFYISRVWGDACYVSQTYNDVDYGNIPGIPRTPEADVLNYCKKDLLTASTYLEYDGGDPSAALRANKGTVYSLLSHIYAWQNQYDSTHIYCQKVMNEAGYTLESMDTYENIWSAEGSAENILVSPMTDNNTSGISETDGINFFGIFLKGTEIDNQRSNAWIIPKSWSWMWQAEDVRFSTMLQAVAEGNGDEAGFMLLKYTNFKYKDPGTKGNPYINNNLVLLRLSDIILLDAEAQASLGNLEEARNLLKITEERAGATTYLDPTDQYGMLDEIVMERGRELIGEGSWYYDLVRTEARQGWLASFGYTAERLSPANKGWCWPLNMKVLFPQNNKLTQNPYWAKNI